jgi:hypothetical protein
LAEVRLSPSQFHAVLSNPHNGPAALIMLRAAERVEAEAVRLCPVDNGDLRDSINHGALKRTGNKLVIRVGTDLEYGLYVHEGTGVHGPKGAPITPKTKPFLAWESKTNVGAPGSPRFNTAWVYAKSVQGMKPRPFLRDALRVL